MHSGDRRGRGRFRLSSAFSSAIAGLLCLPGAFLTVSRLLPWDIGTPWIQLLALFPATLILTVTGAAAALLAAWLSPRSGRLVFAALSCALLMLQLGLVLPRVLPPGPDGAEDSHANSRAGAEVTVMALNVGSSGGDAAAIVAETNARRVDVLALPELSPTNLAALEAAGLGSRFPYRVLDVDWAGTGSGIFSRLPLEPVRRVPGSIFYQSRAMLGIPGLARRLHLTAVHVDSPRPGHTPIWRDELQQLGDVPLALPDAPPAILLGDFNASQDHREFRDLLDTGFTDAAEAAGLGLAPTWPANSRIPPFVAVDHVLVSPGIRVLTFATVALPGTDHMAVVAELAVTD